MAETMDSIYDNPGLCSGEHGHLFHTDPALYPAACPPDPPCGGCRRDLFSDASHHESDLISIVLWYLLEHIDCSRVCILLVQLMISPRKDLLK